MEIKVVDMMRNPTDGLVTSVMWDALKTVGAHTASVNRVVNLTRGDSFVPFESLTEDVVKGWITASLTDKESALIEQMLDRRIALMQNPPVRPVMGKPWTCAPRT